LIPNDPFQGRLLPGERIAWRGTAGRGILFTPRDLFLIPFSLAWCGFAIFWTVTATRGRAPDFFTLWGSMFICFGVYFVAGRFLVDAWVRRGTVYAVTDRRILILRGAPFGKFIALALSQLPDISLSERRGGRGTIRFGAEMSMANNRSAGIWSPALDATPQFIAIEDARRVFDLVQRANQAVVKAS
jgi:hypothetical protein